VQLELFFAVALSGVGDVCDKNMSLRRFCRQKRRRGDPLYSVNTFFNSI
jgi:hypothetical protein